MERSGTLHRRMALLFLVAVALIAWQAPRTKPAEIPAIEVATREGEQLFPIAVPEGAAVQLPRLTAQRGPFLESHSLPWAALPWATTAPAAAPGQGCDLYLRISAQHWARRTLDRGDLARLAPAFAPLPPHAALPALRLRAADFADDDDRDGDPLDPGELHPATAADPAGAEVEIVCQPWV